MNELYLYDIIKKVLSYSNVIEGRFIVAEGYGNDLNTNNLNDIIKDALDNYKPRVRKYPISVLLPPVEIVNGFKDGWQRYQLTQYFLTPYGRKGTNDMKSQNPLTNIAEHTIQQDWKDMREVAGEFRRAFNIAIRNNNLINTLQSASDTPDIYRRVSKVSSDNLNGVSVTYELNAQVGCDFADYLDPEAIDLTTINTNPHPLHKH